MYRAVRRVSVHRWWTVCGAEASSAPNCTWIGRRPDNVSERKMKSRRDHHHHDNYRLPLYRRRVGKTIDSYSPTLER